MERLYLVSKNIDSARRLVTTLRRSRREDEQLRVVPTRRDLPDKLGVPAGSFEETTDILNSRRRGTLTGLITGIVVALVLGAVQTSLPMSLTALVVIGAVSGASLGLVIGTIVGPSEPHPVFLEHRRELQRDAVLLTLDTDPEAVDEVVAAARAADEQVSVEVRTLTEVNALA